MSDAGLERDVDRTSGGEASAGDLAALFEHTPVPVLALSDVEQPRVVAANAAFHERFCGVPFSDVRLERSAGTAAGRRVELSAAEHAALEEIGSERTGPASPRAGLAVPQEANGSANTGGGPDSTRSRPTVVRRTAAGERTFAVEGVAAPGDGDPAVEAFLCYRDVTEGRIRDQQCRVLCRVLRHNLRNTLTVVRGWAEEITARTDSQAIWDAATTILAEVRELDRFADAAGRLDAARDDPGPAQLDDVLTEVRQSVARELDAGVILTAPSACASVNSRIGFGLTELCRLFVAECGAEVVEVEATVREARVVLEVAADVTLAPAQRAALEGRPETQLQHDTGVAAWLARWALRRAGATIDVDSTAGERASLAIEVPVLDGRAGARSVTSPESH